MWVMLAESFISDSMEEERLVDLFVLVDRTELMMWEEHIDSSGLSAGTDAQIFQTFSTIASQVKRIDSLCQDEAR